MVKTQRLNGVIAALEAGQPAFTTFSIPDVTSAIANSTSTDYDGIVFEMEHNPWDALVLRDCLQYMLNRGQIIKSGTLAPGVTPMVRVPANGKELAQWQAKQALDLGVYGVVWPHISSVEEAYNAVAACRYPRLKDKPFYEPQGIRGDGPTGAVRYWGLTQQEYYQKADVWPFITHGEILVVIMIEDTSGIAALSDILQNVPGIGVVLIGEGDLSQELGLPRQYEHPVVLEAMAEIVNICQKNNVAVGHPHVNAQNVQRLLEQGYTFLMAAPVRSTPGMDKGLEILGRKP